MTASAPRTCARLALLLGLLSLSACTGETDEDADLVAPVDCSTEAEPFEAFAEGFVAQNCVRCHSVDNEGSDRNGAPIRVDFDTEAGLLRHRDDVLRYATGSNPIMPPGGGPSDTDRHRFEAYVTCAP